MLVVQSRRVLVVRDDIVIRQVFFARLAGFEIAQVRREFRLAGIECCPCGAMPVRAQAACAAQALEFIGRLDRAFIMQEVQQLRRVDRTRVDRIELCRRPDDRRAAELRPVRACLGRSG